MSRSRKTLRTIVTGDFMESLSYVSSRAAARLWVWRKPADTGPPLNDSSSSQTWERTQDNILRYATTIQKYLEPYRPVSYLQDRWFLPSPTAQAASAARATNSSA